MTDLAAAEGPWESHWRNILHEASAGGLKPLAFFDLDEFVFAHDTIGLGAAEFAARTGTQSDFGTTYEQFKRGEIELDMGDLLTHGINDALASFDNLEEYIAWVQPRQRVTSGFHEFLTLLDENGVGSVGITNGVTPVMEALLKYNGLHFPIAANNIRLTDNRVELECLSDWKIGVNKGLLVRKAIQWGYIICGGGGDSRNDIGLAQAVAEVQGFVIAKRGLGLAKWCKANLDEFKEFENFQEVMPYAQRVLNGLTKRRETAKQL